MRHIIDPRQTQLLDPFKPVFSPAAWKAIQEGWYGVFRHVILSALERPVGVLAQHFCPDNGTPTKELYSMAGLLLIKDFMHWTHEGAADAYMFHAAVQYALNLTPCGQSLCARTIQRYEKHFVEDEGGQWVMDDVTTRLARALETVMAQQRLDSTHVFSDMATFARTRLMGVTIKRFLTQVKRHERVLYDGLPSELRERYEPSQGRLFGEVKTSEGRSHLRQQVAEEMYWLVDRFAEEGTINGRKTYKDLVKVFEQQCTVKTEKAEVEGVEKVTRSVVVRKKTGGNVIQNPSDEGATLDGHKGPGYQVQVAETCSPKNEVQLVTVAIPQTAVEGDPNSMGEVLDRLEETKRMPEDLRADGSYGSDKNVQECARRGVELISPASVGVSEGTDPKANLLAEFEVDGETGKVTRCPAGHAPLYSAYDGKKEKTHVSMAREVCAACPRLESCPVQPRRKRYVVHFTQKRMRLAVRRRAEQTPEFRDRYRKRSGIESTHSGVKRRTGLGRLRVRGRERVFHKIWMKYAGWNILRAASSETLRAKVSKMVDMARKAGSFCRFGAFRCLLFHVHRLLGSSPGLSRANALPILSPVLSRAA